MGWTRRSGGGLPEHPPVSARAAVDPSRGEAPAGSSLYRHRLEDGFLGPAAHLARVQNKLWDVKPRTVLLHDPF